MEDNKNQSVNPTEAYEDDASIVILTDEDGTDSEFELLDIINYSGTEYAVLVPNEEDADQVVIFRIEDGDQETNTLIPVNSQETANAIFGLFKEKNKDKFDFT